MPGSIRNCCLLAMAVLGFTGVQAGLAAESATAAAGGATASTPLADEEPLMELDEIIVRGERLHDVIIEAETEFYKLYNQLNKNDDYDVNCAHVNVDPENRTSMVRTRVCIPGFVANAIADFTVWKRQCRPPMEGFDEFSCLDQNDDERLSRQEVSMRPELDVRLMELDEDHNGYLTRDELPEEGMQGPPVFQPPSPELVLMEGTDKWYRHMLAVTRSDPRLLEMAGRLDDLHREYVELARQESRHYEDGDAPTRPVNYSRGPRER